MAAIEKFCHLKAMSVLEVGEKIGQIFRSDCEVYPTFLQYCSEMPITQYQGVCRKEVPAKDNHNTLKEHGFQLKRDEEVPEGR